MAGQFFAFLSGNEEVPPVVTMASGSAFFSVSPDQRQIDFRLTVNNIERMTEAHIHLGRRGENGPIVVFLFGPVSPGISVAQELITGTFTQEAFIGPLSGEPMSVLIGEMLDGNTYVNVHTEQNPAGEIRGQIQEY
ncbi:MAG: CHRD domain-containing protein [Candidatus Desulforudis sp.]|nr:CHRD domain-containing protein [Desulforudis sp.]